MKKIFAILLALVLVLAMGIPAMAEGTGSITIENATIGEDYAIYKVFDATYSGSYVAYTYTASGADDALLAALKGAGSPFTLTQTSTENVYNVTSTASATEISTWLNANVSLLTKTASQDDVTSSTVTFSGIAYGYYYITSSLGSVVTINSAAPNVTVLDKNQTGPANLTKKIVEGNTAVDSNSVSIGETVNFKIEFNATNYDGETPKTQYSVTDTMGKGFTLTESSIVVKVKDNADGTEETLTKVTDYTVSTVTDTANNDATVTTITIDWQDADGNFKFGQNSTVTITYSAVVNENADPEDLTTLQNAAAVEDLSDTTTTTTYFFELVKTDENNVVIDGAKFRLYDAQTGGNEIAVVADGVGGYRVAKTGETGVDIVAGYVRVSGLKAGTYWLEEVEQPAGYNKLASRVEVAISTANLNATVSENIDVDNEDNEVKTYTYDEGGVQVVNQAGSELPSTSGIGTTIFYVVGGLLMAAAVVLLVTKKKVSSK